MRAVCCNSPQNRASPFFLIGFGLGLALVFAFGLVS